MAAKVGRGGRASAQNTEAQASQGTGPCGAASSGQRICGGKLETVGRLLGVVGGREPLASRGQRYLVQGFRKLADRPHPLAGDLNRQPCLARLPQRATARENLGEAGSDTVMTPVFYPRIQTETLLYSVILILPSTSLGSLSIQHGCA